jgi:hypothetical protein
MIARMGLEDRRALPDWALAAGLAVLTLVAVRLARGEALWTAGSGIYGLTAHLFLHGRGLYGGLIAAQPPNQFLVGAAFLGVHDTLDGLRAGVGLLQLGSGLLVGTIVWRLTGSRLAAILAPAATLLTPWAIHENGAFIPEVVAMPLLLGATLLAARKRTAGLAGALMGVAVFVKLPMLAPLIILGVAAQDRRRYALWAVTALAAQALLFMLLFGHGFWDDIVGSELQTGHRGLRTLVEIVTQAGWNSGAIVVLAAVGVRLSARAADPALARTAIALAIGVLATFVSVFKNGTGLYVLTNIETGCLPLAIGAVVWLAPAWRPLAGAVAVLLLAQSASVIAAPHDPRIFVRPGAPRAYAADLTDAQVHAAVRAARACPPGVAYSGEAYIALLANRPMPAGQPDTYITSHAKRFRAVRARALRERTCP